MTIPLSDISMIFQEVQAQAQGWAELKRYIVGFQQNHTFVISGRSVKTQWNSLRPEAMQNFSKPEDLISFWFSYDQIIFNVF